MGTEQYRTGLCSVTTASQIVIGTASCDWLNQIITTPAIFKADLNGESTYSIGTVNSATRITLSANYTGSTNSGMSYMICRSFTTNRGFWRPLQGDYDFAEILSQDTIDNIDEDIAHIMTGNATIDGTIDTSFGIDTDGNTLRIRSTNLSASRYYHFPNYNASIAAKSASNDWTGNQKFDTVTASDINATTGDIETLHSTTFTASDINASEITIKNWNIMHSRKKTVAIADTTTASTGQVIGLFDAAIGDVIYDVMGNVTTGFKFGGTATLIKIEIGDKTDTDGFARAHLCGSSTLGIIMEGQTGLLDKGAYFFNASAARIPKVYTAAASIVARITSSGDTVYMASLDAGSINVYVDMISRI